MKLNLRTFAAALLLLGVVSACGKGDEGGGKTNPAPPQHKVLLDLLQEQAAAYGKSASVPVDHVFICAHRGITVASVQKGLPEQCIPTIEEAIAQGADMVELDVRLTKDGVPMLMHDASLSTTTDGSGNIENKTAEQVKALKMHPRGKSNYPQVDGEFIRVPTLKEALEVCKGRIYVNLDIKNCTSDVLLRTILEADAFDDVMIYGYSTDQKKDNITWALTNAHTWLAVHPYISNPDDIKSYMTDSYHDCALLFQYNEDVYYDNSTPRFGFKCHGNGGLAYSNSLLHDSEITTWYNNYLKNGIEDGPCTVLDRFVAAGNDFLQTNMLEYAHEYFKEKGLR